MKLAQVANVTRAQMMGTRVGIADRWWLRLRGLLGRPELQVSEGLLLTPCNAVHMYGMKYPLDVAMLDRSGVVVAVYHVLQPGRRTQLHRTAFQTLELPAGTLRATGTSEGDVLVTTPSSDPSLS